MHNDAKISVCGACDVSRREFLSRSAIASAGVLLAAACGTGVWEPLSPTIPTGGVTLTLADYPALNAVGGIALVTPQGTSPLAIVHASSATYLALSRICPHQGTIVNLNGSGFLCPNHQARFSSTGQWQGGQSTSNLVSLSVVYNAAAGTLLVGA
jgi:Rieske Fe-S protein